MPPGCYAKRTQASGSSSMGGTASVRRKALTLDESGRVRARTLPLSGCSGGVARARRGAWNEPKHLTRMSRCARRSLIGNALALRGQLRPNAAPQRLFGAAAIILIMERAVVLGRGAAGKSTAALDLGRITGLPVIELDKHFWRPGLAPMPQDEWTQLQHVLAAPGR